MLATWCIEQLARLDGAARVLLAALMLGAGLAVIIVSASSDEHEGRVLAILVFIVIPDIAWKVIYKLISVCTRIRDRRAARLHGERPAVGARVRVRASGRAVQCLDGDAPEPLALPPPYDAIDVRREGAARVLLAALTLGAGLAIIFSASLFQHQVRVQLFLLVVFALEGASMVTDKLTKPCTVIGDMPVAIPAGRAAWPPGERPDVGARVRARASGRAGLINYCGGGMLPYEVRFDDGATEWLADCDVQCLDGDASTPPAPPPPYDAIEMRRDAAASVLLAALKMGAGLVGIIFSASSRQNVFEVCLMWYLAIFTCSPDMNKFTSLLVDLLMSKLTSRAGPAVWPPRERPAIGASVRAETDLLEPLVGGGGAAAAAASGGAP